MRLLAATALIFQVSILSFLTTPKELTATFVSYLMLLIKIERNEKNNLFIYPVVFFIAYQLHSITDKQHEISRTGESITKRCLPYKIF